MHPQSTPDARGPEGTHRSVRSAAAVAGIFAEIADIYDTGSDLISVGLVRLWRRQLVEMVCPEPDDRILDVCTGTGDVALSLADRVPRGGVVGVDFSPPMLERAREKTPTRTVNRISFQEGDATKLPLPADSFDIAVNAFGLRNVTDIPAAWAEMARVLRPGGRAFVLDLALPPVPVFREIYGLYVGHLLPLVARLVHHRREPYHHLGRSLAGFPSPPELREQARAAGFSSSETRPLLGGTAVTVRSTLPTEPDE